MKLEGDAEIVVKKDSDLTKEEVDQVFEVYNKCFYDDQLVKPDYIKMAKDCLSKSSIFEWFMVKVNGRVVAISNFVYDFKNAKQKGFAINEAEGENVSSVAVLPTFRQKGYCRNMMEKIVEVRGDDVLGLELKRDHPHYDQMLKFYKSLNFELNNGNLESVFLLRPKTVSN
jgi:ribosomal protein S18 acetylase RimI-like enzyme